MTIGRFRPASQTIGLHAVEFAGVAQRQPRRTMIGARGRLPDDQSLGADSNQRIKARW